MVDVGDLPVERGDEVVLLGAQGDETITAAEWARRLGTIPYEIVCGIGPRVPRRYLDGTRHAVKRRTAARSWSPRPRRARPHSGTARSAPSGRGSGAGPTTVHARALDAPLYSRRTGSRPTTPARSTPSLPVPTTAPPIVLSHGVTLSVRTWFYQLEALPDAGFRVDRVRPSRPRRVGGRRHRPLGRQPRRGRPHGARVARPTRRGARRPLDGRGRGAGVRHPLPGDRAGTGTRHRAALDARRVRRSPRTSAATRSRSIESCAASLTARRCGTRRTSASSSRASASARARNPATSNSCGA